MEVIKTFIKTKENGENIYKMLNVWLRSYRSILCLYEKGNKGYNERDRKVNVWRAVEQFLIVFLLTNKGESHTLKGRTFLFFTFAKNLIIQITSNAILYH